jgi:putative lipoic acid-binding regulatory protein
LSADERTRALELLEATHVFPTDYCVAVIALNSEEVTACVVAAAVEELPHPVPAAHEVRPSAKGKYVSHRLIVRCTDAEHVLRLFARLRAVDGVMTIL